MALLAESLGDPASLAAPLREFVRTLDPDQPINNVRTMEELFHMRVVGVMTAIVRSVAAMGTMGLALSIVGLYGLVAYTANRRTREIGIRMAMGAEPADVLRLVLGQGMVPILMGVTLGLAMALSSASLVSGLLFGVSATDPATYVAVPSILAGVALLAAYVPARRATRIDPLAALREE